ncbi:MAG: PD-(D/E)XK nuclease family protein, partial [Pontixanthobacter sp.]
RPADIVAMKEKPDAAQAIAMPAWIDTPVGPEPRPPRPLAPSSAGEDMVPDPPLSTGETRDAAQRGVLIHALLERLPAVAPDKRVAGGRDWLMRHADDLAPEEREEMIVSALQVIDTPDYASIFSADALAEVPLSATVDGQVVAGIADRLLIEGKRVTVVDFKTARRPPMSLDQVPYATIRQMAAYAAALGVIYPEHEVRAAVLYTHAPRLIPIPAELLESNKPGLSSAQESFNPRMVE